MHSETETTQDRLIRLAQEINQTTGCGWHQAWNIACKVLVAAGDLEIEPQR